MSTTVGDIYLSIKSSYQNKVHLIGTLCGRQKNKQYFKQEAKPPVLFKDTFSQEIDENIVEKKWVMFNLETWE